MFACNYLSYETHNRVDRRALARARFITDPGTPGAAPATPPAMGPRQLRTVAFVAAMLGVTDRSVRNFISRGLFPAYRIPGTRGVRIDQRDVERAMKLIPTVAPPKPTFGSGATIIDIPRQVEYVTPAELAAPTPGTDA